MAATVQQPVSPLVVGNAFVQQYYHILHESPTLVYRFYQDISKIARPELDGSMSTTSTMQAINEKIQSLNYGEFRAEIKSVDSQDSFDGGVQVLVTGYMTGKDDVTRNFAQSFFLAPQDSGYFVLNDIFRYIGDVSHNGGNQGSSIDADSPITPVIEPSSVMENHCSEQTVTVVEDVNGEEVYNPPENAEELIVEEEMPMAEVVDEAQDDSQSQMVVETKSKIEEVPKKTYASIVMDMKQSGVPFSSPAPPPRRSVAKVQEQQVNSTLPQASVVETLVSNSEAMESGNNQETEADGYSVYIKGLPFHATPAQLEDEFKRFGTIKTDGIQVRSNKQQGFCFGFVEFEVADAVQKAIEASPVTIGGRQAFVEEKRSTNSRVNNRGRFSNGRVALGGYRNEGVRGRAGNYGGGRGGGYNGGSRGDYNGGGNNRGAEFGNNRNNRGGFGPNRGGDGYQRGFDNNNNTGSRMMNRGGGGMEAGNRAMAPRVSAAA